MEALLGGKPLRLSLKGLDYMSDDPTDMHVLYLKVSDAVQRDKVQYSPVQSVHHSTAQYSMVGHRLTQMWPAPSNMNPMLLRYISYCVRHSL